jgi:hypothetical protein
MGVELPALLSIQADDTSAMRTLSRVRGAISRDEEPQKPEAQAKVTESQELPSLALQALIIGRS